MQIVDLGYFEEGDLNSLIDAYDPDAVVFIYGIGYLGESYMFSLAD